MTNPTIYIATQGCRVNQYESSAMAGLFAEAGFAVVQSPEKANVCLFNSCTVTAESDRKARQSIRRLLRSNPNTKIIVTGCYSQRTPDEIAAISGVALVCGNKEKLQVVQYALALVRGEKIPQNQVTPMDNAPFEEMQAEEDSRTRAYIKIQDGCSRACSYCIIPAVRGAARSRPMDSILAEANRLCAAGYVELVIAGIEVSNFQPGLVELLRRLSEIATLRRIRLCSLYPTTITCDFADAVAALPKVMPHFHLSMQSGSREVLQRMNRPYDPEKIAEYMAYMREKIPAVSFSGDFIVGFPGESEENFAETCTFVEQAGFMDTHIFPFSSRPSTPAADMPQISPQVKKSRAARLAEVGETAKARHLSAIASCGEVMDVLCETSADGVCEGLTPCHARIRFHGAAAQGQIVSVRPERVEGGVLWGECRIKNEK
ncbi:MAG: tRNA (N(6)-L-threonylcarbamoyladenosine(37)-C(2))-methylthiotransferase MtaB [Oscillospiraceae bacterium]|nr:tRNA (N(6)-L-threonylcarbamoyladenosine(37)-C(2))-methylthiotransferase MtaB [Oscillospiraceae bacterium]